MKTEEIRTIDELTEHVRELRRLRDVHDARFLLGLCEIEERYFESLLKPSGVESYDAWLDSLELVKPSRYRSFVRGLEAVGREQALAIGSEATIGAARLTNADKVPLFVQSVAARIEEHHGLQPTRQTVDKILTDIDPVERTPGALGRKTEVARLRVENEKLRSQLAASCKALDKANREIANLRQKLAMRKKAPLVADA
jgi:regulator of replication initiation timing